jgi:hypothetical protein
MDDKLDFAKNIDAFELVINRRLYNRITRALKWVFVVHCFVTPKHPSRGRNSFEFFGTTNESFYC